MLYTDSIVALATPSGAGAIAIVRIFGEDIIDFYSMDFLSNHPDFFHQKSGTFILADTIP